MVVSYLIHIVCLTISKEPNRVLTENIAPALDAVKYEIQHFDLPPMAEGPFIGKGPQVDAMWDYITDGRMSDILEPSLTASLTDLQFLIR